MSTHAPVRAALALTTLLGLAGCSAPVLPAPGGASAARAVQDAYVHVVDRVAPSVVVIRTPTGLGSGVVYDGRGDIVTNAHVVAGASRFGVTLWDGRQYEGALVGTFPPDDLAVVRIQAPNLRPARFADSSRLRVGDTVLAIGNPLGLQSSVTTGIVSAVGRTVSEGGAALPDAIQTSAPINPGNSGGALVDLDGTVVGIPTLAAVDPELGSAAPGIGFAIPSVLVTDIADQIIAGGRVVNGHRAYLGATIANATGGVLVDGVDADGPADRADIRPGDVIVAVAGRPVGGTAALATALASQTPGQRIPVTIVRPNGSRDELEATLGEYPTS